MLNESRKILSAPDINVTCTCVRVPVMRSHSVSKRLPNRIPYSAQPGHPTNAAERVSVYVLSLRTEPGTTDWPVSALSIAAKQRAKEARLSRASMTHSRCSSMAHNNSPIVPWKPSGNHFPDNSGFQVPCSVVTNNDCCWLPLPWLCSTPRVPDKNVFS